MVEYVADPGTCWYGSLTLLSHLMREVRQAGGTAIKPQFWPASLYKGHKLERTALLCELHEANIESIIDLAKLHKLDLWFSVFGLREFKLLEDKFPQTLKTVKIAESQSRNHKLFNKVLASENVERIVISLASNDAYIDMLTDDKFTYGWDNTRVRRLYCCPKYPSTYKDIKFPRSNKGEGSFGDCQSWFGFSDHTQDELASATAVALGAEMVEKHVRPIPITYTSVAGRNLRRYPDDVCDVNSHVFGLMIETCNKVREMIHWS